MRASLVAVNTGKKLIAVAVVLLMHLLTVVRARPGHHAPASLTAPVSGPAILLLQCFDGVAAVATGVARSALACPLVCPEVATAEAALEVALAVLGTNRPVVAVGAVNTGIHDAAGRNLLTECAGSP